MDDVPTIHFGSVDRQVSIALHRRSFPTATELWDRDAITATASVKAGPFRGELELFVWSHELLALARLLLGMYEHVGHIQHEEFAFLDHDLWFAFDLDMRGHLTVQVVAQSGDDPRLSFSIDADQSYLPIWHLNIREALAYFQPEIQPKSVLR